ncbi:hypothetical protein ACJ73_10213 [Blastomyces percursus]|uniref:Uncharacterized protein n=1 Tax=Blastomyces percursus TaxID=1658174 RepID=A0A1J9P024_9EURO|nr:hypothetical protein ACJ73_10213 [Blastomyces percursus]
MRTPFWLKNPQKVRQSGQLGASMVITVESLEIAQKICADGLRFGGIRHRADLYWEVGPDAVCPCCCGLGHQSFKACGEREPRCYVCGGPHTGAEHRCEVRECTARAGHPCAHLPAKCANCGKGHTALLNSCPARKEARKRAWKAGQKELARQETLSTATPSLRSQEPPTSPPFQKAVINRRPKATPVTEKNHPSSRNVALKDPMRTPELRAKGPSGWPNLPETPRTQRTQHIPISPIDIDIDIGPEHLAPSIAHLEASQ